MSDRTYLIFFSAPVIQPAIQQEIKAIGETDV